MPLTISRNTIIEDIKTFLAKEEITLAVVYGPNAPILKKDSEVKEWPYLAKPSVTLALMSQQYGAVMSRYSNVDWPYPFIRILVMSKLDEVVYPTEIPSVYYSQPPVKA